jgi:NADPH:quinone reductase-like Zn-dependent oxidoreductase
MKAIVYARYGSPDVLDICDVEMPSIGDDEVLVKVHAASLNPYDWHLMRGSPSFVRLISGLRKPKSTRLGADLAGTVEAIGQGVTEFSVGDEVFGQGAGSCAEYVSAHHGRLAHKPDALSFEAAAAVPIAGVTALQGLRDKGQLQEGQSVLVNGAAGGVGTFAVQIARALGGEVTGVCSTRNVDLVRSLGAAHVVDHTSEDFASGTTRYDFILDAVGNRSLSDLRRALTKTGTLRLVGGVGGPVLGPMGLWLRSLLVSRFVGQRLAPVGANVTSEDLLALNGLIEEGRVTPVIDRTYALVDAAAAVRYLEAGHARGKVIVTP